MFWKSDKEDLRDVFPIENLPLEVLGSGNRDALSLLYRNRDEESLRSGTPRIPLKSAGKTAERAVFLKKMLPILDSFDSVLKYGKVQDSHDEILANWLKSMESMHRRLISVLEQEGLIVIDSVGKPLDLTIHEVIEAREVTGIRHNHVVEEIAKGYICANRVLRDAQVIVAKNPENIGVGVNVLEYQDEEPADADVDEHYNVDEPYTTDENQWSEEPKDQDRFN